MCLHQSKRLSPALLDGGPPPTSEPRSRRDPSSPSTPPAWSRSPDAGHGAHSATSNSTPRQPVVLAPLPHLRLNQPKAPGDERRASEALPPPLNQLMSGRLPPRAVDPRLPLGGDRPERSKPGEGVEPYHVVERERAANA